MLHGNYRRAVQSFRAIPACAERQCEPQQPAGGQRYSLCGRARLQLARVAQTLDSTSVKVQPDGTGALKKTDRKPSESPEQDGPPKFIWLPRMLGSPSHSP